MKSEEHHRQAESLLSRSEDADPDHANHLAAVALVHAVLAVAEAILGVESDE